MAAGDRHVGGADNAGHVILRAEEVLELLSPNASGKELEVVLRYPPGTPSRLVGDAA